MKRFLLRVVVALALLLPYTLAPIAHPFWMTFVVALFAFGVAHGVASLRHVAARAVATVLLLAAGGTVIATTRARRTIDAFVETEVVAGDLPAYEGERLQLHGHVAAGTLRADGRRYRFDVEGAGGERIAAAYEGAVPDGFRERTEVVLTGTLLLAGGAWRFEATNLVARCPQSYPVAPARR